MHTLRVEVHRIPGCIKDNQVRRLNSEHQWLLHNAIETKPGGVPSRKIRCLPDVVGDVFVGELLAGIARVVAQPQRRLGHVEPQQPTPHLVTHLRDEDK